MISTSYTLIIFSLKLFCFCVVIYGGPIRKTGKKQSFQLAKRVGIDVNESKDFKNRIWVFWAYNSVSGQNLVLICACRSLLCKDSLADAFCTETVNAAQAFVAGHTSWNKGQY